MPQFEKKKGIKLIQGLIDQSKKPHSSPNQKITAQLTKLVLDLREERNLGARRIQTELIRLDYITFLFL